MENTSMQIEDVSFEKLLTTRRKKERGETAVATAVAIRDTLFLEFPQLSGTLHGKRRPKSFSPTIPAEIHFGVAGNSIDASAAYQKFATAPPVLAPIIADDEPSTAIVRHLEEQFPRLQPIKAADQTPISIQITADDGLEVAEWEMSTKIDEQTALKQLGRFLDPSRRLVVGAEVSQHPRFVRRVFEAHADESVVIFDSKSEIDHREAMAIAAMCSLVVVPHSVLEEWSGIRNDIPAAIIRARSQHVNSILVPAAESGIFGWIDDQWVFAPAFEINGEYDATRNQETILGTFLAAYDRGESAERALRIASAAAALKEVGLLENATWHRIYDFAAAARPCQYKAPRPQQTTMAS